LPSEAAATRIAPPCTSHTPLSTANEFFLPSLKSAERRTSRLPPGTLPGCGSVGPPVWSCHSPWSFWVTRPSSPFGSPLRGGKSGSVVVSYERVGSAPCDRDSA